MFKNPLGVGVLSILTIAAFTFAGRQLAHIGNANGLDTANVSGALRATKALIVRDTFASKSGNFLQFWKAGSKVAHMDSAGRFFTPALLVNTSTVDGNALRVNGTASIGTTLYMNGSISTMIKTAHNYGGGSLAGLHMGAIEGGGAGWPVYFTSTSGGWYQAWSSNGIVISSTAKTANVSAVRTAASALIDFQSTTQGVYFPRMNSTQRDVQTWGAAATIFCTDCTATDASTGVLQTYNGTVWKNHW